MESFITNNLSKYYYYDPQFTSSEVNVMIVSGNRYVNYDGTTYGPGSTYYLYANVYVLPISKNDSFKYIMTNNNSNESTHANVVTIGNSNLNELSPLFNTTNFDANTNAVKCFRILDTTASTFASFREWFDTYNPNNN